MGVYTKIDKLHKCPYCGATATVFHVFDTYDRADYGWDAGCPRYCVVDKVHDHSLPIPKVCGFTSKERAVKAWNIYCERLKERIKEG